MLGPSEGKILVNDDEKNYHEISREKIGYIPQDHLIVSDKIIRNITLEDNEKFIDKNKLNYTIKSLNLENLINTLPDGIDTLIGKDGIRLSGGQYKKLALARLFYHDKEVLIMDEATNSLDKSSVEALVNELKIKKDKTIIVISHDEETLGACDKIFKIDNKMIKNNNNLN